MRETAALTLVPTGSTEQCYRRAAAATAVGSKRFYFATRFFPPRRAEPGIRMLHADGQFAVRVAAEVYRGILREIEQNGYDVFERRAVVPPSRKAWIAARRMAVPMARHTMHRLAFWKSMNV